MNDVLLTDTSWMAARASPAGYAAGLPRTVMPSTRTLLCLLALVLPVSAAAQDAARAVNIELVRPTFSPRAGFGTDTPYIERAGQARGGLQLQYQRAPLQLIAFDEVQGEVVRNRAVAQAGASYAISERFAARVVVPVALHFDSEPFEPELDGDGVGLSDLMAGVRYRFGAFDDLTLGMHVDAWVPVGNTQQYMGEATASVWFGFLGAYELDDLLLATDLGVHVRPQIETGYDFALGSELVWNTMAAYDVSEVVAITGEILIRAGFNRFLEGPGENSMEWLVGGAFRPAEGWRIDVGVGRGITQGYGTTAARAMLGLTYSVVPEPPPEVEPVLKVEIIELPEDDLPSDEQLVVEDEPDPEALARIEDTRIVIRDPIQFELGTARILPVSIPTLRAVASLMNGNAAVGHLVIEGHASEEGSYPYNYDLSIRRAKAVYEQLIVSGIHPFRMSYRGMGEVVPVAEGSDEAALELNRRVEFHIVRQYRADEAIPEYPTTIDLPWSGAEARVRNPERKPVAPPPPPRIVPDDDIVPTPDDPEEEDE